MDTGLAPARLDPELRTDGVNLALGHASKIPAWIAPTSFLAMPASMNSKQLRHVPVSASLGARGFSMSSSVRYHSRLSHTQKYTHILTNMVCTEHVAASIYCAAAEKGIPRE